MIWGVDLGVRSAYAAGLAGDQLYLECLVLKPKKHSRSQELRLLHEWATQFLGARVFIEEPPLAGARNIRTFLGLAQASGVLLAATGGQLVPVDTWKLGAVGRGGVSKDLVSEWLLRSHPAHHGACGGNQNLVDATAIAHYGRGLDPRYTAGS